MQKSFLLTSALVLSLGFALTSSASIDVTRAHSPLTNDPLITYQWGLRTSAQTLFRDIDDIHSERVDAVQGQLRDIGLMQAPAMLDKAMKRNIVVAVVDSGIDFDHEDMNANIFLNKLECDDDRIPFKPDADKDDNGYKGDCAGWNFTAQGDGDNRTADDLGHGTHVAGIIAAASGNGIGISGVSNKIKLLPLKVTYICDEQPREEDCPKLIKKQPPLATRIQKALAYAVKMKVDVINFSMGWPISQDSVALRDAFKAARAQGILIVAAAGNNTSSAPVYPCSYEGVICVGASSIDGRAANFSNFGGHVDFFAPGEEILSAIPKAIESMNFSVKGYEIKNGTSQAAPYVSAQLAVLKGLLPNATADELIGRLHASARPLLENTKYGVSGVTHLSQALSSQGVAVVRPVFKSLNQVNYSHRSKKFRLEIPMKSYWKAAGNVSVKLSVSSSAVRLAKTNLNLGQMAPGELRKLSVDGDVLNASATKDIMLQMEVAVSGQAAQTFRQRLTFTRQIAGDSDLQNLLVRTSKPQDIGHVSTIHVLDDSATDPEYYTANVDEAGVHVRVLRRSGNEFREAGEILVPGAKVLKFIMKADLNYDGQLDYMLITFTPISANKGKITYSYIRSNLTGLLGSASHMENPVEGAIIGDDSLKDLILMPMTTALGRIAVPVFRTEGVAPKVDTNPDPFEFEENIKRTRLYYLQPSITNSGAQILTRNFDNHAFDRAVRSKLGINDRPAVKLIDLIPQSRSERLRGEVRAVLTVEDERGAQHLEMKITASQLPTHGFSLRALNIGDVRIEGGQLAQVLGLNQDRNTEETSLVSFFTPTLARLAILDNATRVTHQQKVQPARAQDHLLGHVASYRSGSRVFGVYQTKSQLTAQVSDGSSQQRHQADIDRCSFVPGRVFNSSFSPIRFNMNGKQVPAIYVDTTPLTALRVHTWAVTDQGLVAPMYLNLEIPQGCRAMTPQRFNGSQDYSYVLLCKEGENLALKTLPIR